MAMLEFHPLANLFPLIEGEDFARLVEDIRRNGLKQPIVLFENKILDGRNRYGAATEAGIVLGSHSDLVAAGVARYFDPKTEGDPLAWVLSLNLHRRHLNETQRAAVAAKLEGFTHGGARRGEEYDANWQLDRAKASELLNVSERSTARAAKVLHEGAPELFEKLEKGEVAVSVAVQLLTLPKDQQADMARLVEPGKLKTVAKQVGRADKEKRLAQKQRALPLEQFNVILADPAWRFEPYSRETGMDRAADNHYPTQETPEIMALPVGTLAASDCVLFLWATPAMLCEALRVMRFWGFEYKSNYDWRKQKAGTGYWSRNRHEHLLIGTRGNIPAPAPGTQWDSVIDAPAGQHSEKPDAVYEMIEQYYPNVPKIELNARRARTGWAAWGNEAPEANSPEAASGGAAVPPIPGTPQAAEGAHNPTSAATYADLLAASAELKGRHTQRTAEPIMRAAYADLMPLPQLADDLGHPKGTIKTWAHRLKLTDRARELEYRFKAAQGGGR
jgi:N6-adenosine-specific RNA methylase IME4